MFLLCMLLSITTNEGDVGFKVKEDDIYLKGTRDGVDMRF